MATKLPFLANYVAAQVDAYPQLNFSLDNPNAPNTIYLGADPAANSGLQLAITTNRQATLNPGPPVSIDQAVSVQTSLIYLDLSPFRLSDAAFQSISVAADGWEALRDLPNRTICLAPKGPVYLQGKQARAGVRIAGLAVADPAAGGSLQLEVTYYNVEGINIAKLGLATPISISLVLPPDQRDADLHGDLSLSVEPALVLCSNDHSPEAGNQLLLTFFAPTQQSRAVKSGPQTEFQVHFLYADEWPGRGALCTFEQGNNIAPAAGSNAQDWTVELIHGEYPYISLRPPDDTDIIGSGDRTTIQFRIGNIVTHLQTGSTLLTVTYSGIPKYRDGSYQIPISKLPHAAIKSFTVTPNSAQLLSPDGIQVTLEWQVADAVALRLTSASVLDRDVTNSGSYSTSITRRTDFTLEADGFSFGPVNKATCRRTAIITPHIYFNVAISPDDGAQRITWNVLGATTVGIDAPQGLQKPVGAMTLRTPIAPPYAYTLKAFDSDGAQIGSAILRRAWAIGESADLGPLDMRAADSQGKMLVSPDGKRLYVLAGNPLQGAPRQIVILDASTLNKIDSIATIPAWTMAFALAPDSSRIYIVHVEHPNTTLTVIDARTFAVIAAATLAGLEIPFTGRVLVAATDKYIFIVPALPAGMVVLDVRTLAPVLVADTGNQRSQGCGLSLSRKRAYRACEDSVKALDRDTLKAVESLDVPASSSVRQLTAAADDSYLYVMDSNSLWIYAGAMLINRIAFGAWETPQTFAVTSDLTQCLLLSPTASPSVTIGDFDADSRSFSRNALLYPGAGQSPGGIVLTPDNSRVFVATADPEGRKGSVTALVPIYT